MDQLVKDQKPNGGICRCGHSSVLHVTYTEGEWIPIPSPCKVGTCGCGGFEYEHVYMEGARLPMALALAKKMWDLNADSIVDEAGTGADAEAYFLGFWQASYLLLCGMYSPYGDEPWSELYDALEFPHPKTGANL